MSEEPTTVTVADKLTEYDLDSEGVKKIETEFGATSLDDLAVLTEEDLVSAGMKVVPARKLLAELQPASPASEAAAIGAASIESVLPGVPDDGSWLEALKVGGVLRVEDSTVISAIRAALAARVGLYQLPKKLVDAMEAFAETNDEQVDPAFFDLRQQVTRRSYAEVFEAVPGLDGNYVTDARKQQLFERIDSYLWPSILTFNEQLKGWVETWQQQGMNPTMLAQIIAGAPMAQAMMQPPDTGVLQASAEAVNDALNRVFAGTGVQITAGVAYEATQIKKTLEDSRLPALIGAANRDQMLKQLDAGVSSSYTRLEKSLTKFVLGCIKAKDVPAGDEEAQYFFSLYALGNQIAWGELGGGSGAVTAIGGRKDL